MSVLVFAAPYVPPPPPVSKWQGFSVVWAGPDGSVWDLHDAASGVFLLPIVVGLHNPEWTRLARPRLGGGQRTLDVSPKPRKFELSVLVFSDDSSAHWRAVNEAWQNAWDPRDPGTLTITAPDGRWRSIDLKLESSGDYAYRLDPSQAGWASFPIQAVADDPDWLGAPVEGLEWSQVSPPDYYPATGGPPYEVAPDFQLDSAVVANPGDEPAWMVWRIRADGGPVTAATVTMAGGTFGVATSIPDGSTALIDTRAGVGLVGVWDDVAGALLSPTDISGVLTPWRPRPLPPKVTSPIGFSITGNATVNASFRPRFRRAFG